MYNFLNMSSLNYPADTSLLEGDKMTECGKKLLWSDGSASFSNVKCQNVEERKKKNLNSAPEAVCHLS